MGPEWMGFLLTALTSCSILFYCLCIAAARRFFTTKPSAPVGVFPPATLLVPLCGSDFKAYENYASFCRQEYPVYQIVFGVQDPEDSSIEVIRKLMADFPQADVELMIDCRCIGVNPKVNNLHNMLAKAKYDVLVIVDSDIRVKPDYLATLIPPTQDERIGLVTTFYRAGEAPSFAAKLEALGITSEFAPGVLAARLTEGMSFALGATMALTRQKLEAIGGFQAVAHYLADDFMLGNLLWRAGFEIRLLPYTVETLLPPSGMRKMFRHQVRWTRGIRACRPWGHTGSLVTLGTVLGILIARVHGGSPTSLVFFVVAISTRLAMAWTVGVQMLGDRILARSFHLLPLRDIFSFAVWMVSLVGKTVEWRGRFFRIVENGKIVPMESVGE
jgi:ceramide glucosyltransferase